MKYIFILFLSLTSLAHADAQNSQTALTDDPWYKKWQEVCSYDSGWCTKLRTGLSANGDWTPPKPEIVEILRASRPIIRAAAARYGVDPRAIAGAILTENSLNLDMKHQAELWYAKFNEGAPHVLFGKHFGTGIGQLHDDTVRDVEPRAAAVEKRPVLTDYVEIHRRMASLEGSINYVAAVLKDAQDVYAKHGFNISKDIGVLTTLYNLGGYDWKASQLEMKKKIDPKVQPRINHFGFFVDHNEALLGSIVGYTPPAKTEEPTQDSRKITTVSTKLNLTNVPNSCDGIATAKPSGSLEPGTPYKVIGNDVDCNLSKWTLVQSGDGSLGWISAKNLAAASVTKNSSIHCQADEVPECSSSLASLAHIKYQAAPKDKDPKKSAKLHLLSVPLQKATDCNDDPTPVAPPIKRAEFTHNDYLSGSDANVFYTSVHDWLIDPTHIDTRSPGWSAVFDNVFMADLLYSRALVKADKIKAFIAAHSAPPTPQDLADAKALLSENYFSLDRYNPVSNYSYNCTAELKHMNADLQFTKTVNYLLDLEIQSAITYDHDPNEGRYTNFDSVRTTHGRMYIYCQSLKQEAQKRSASSQGSGNIPSWNSQNVTGMVCQSCQNNFSQLENDLVTLLNGISKDKTPDDHALELAKKLFKPEDLKLNFKPSAAVAISDCGFDQDSAAQKMKELLKTGCVGQIFVNDLSWVDYLAKKNINVGYSPMSDDEYFQVEPKATWSCGSK